MTNHVHLLLTPSESDSCGYLFRDLGRSYVRYFNRRHGRTGTLWEGRFRSCLAESPLYVLACYRYIELNPVRAGMVQHPEGHLWSSYAVNGGMRTDPLIKFHEEFLALAADTRSRHAAYRALFDEKLDERIQESIRHATNGGYPLASESFKASVIAPLGARTQRGKPGPKVESPEASYALD